MSNGFTNDVIGVNGTLVRAQIVSPNFSLENQTGWAILKNGDAFFFNLTAAGSVTSNTVIVKGSGDGIFVYDGTPGVGKLLLAIGPGGTDDFGNPYSGPGISLSAPGLQNEIQIRADLKAMLVYA